MERSMILETVENPQNTEIWKQWSFLPPSVFIFLLYFQLALQLPEEVVEFVDFLKSPKKYQQLGEGQGIFALCPVGWVGKLDMDLSPTCPTFSKSRGI